MFYGLLTVKINLSEYCMIFLANNYIILESELHTFSSKEQTAEIFTNLSPEIKPHICHILCQHSMG